MMLRAVGFSSLAFLVASIPMLASAATLMDTLQLVSTFLNAAIGILIVLAIVVFFWGVVKYLFTSGGTDAAAAVQLMFWGVVAIFVMVSIWGIIKLLQATFKVTSTDPVVPKGIQLETRGY